MIFLERTLEDDAPDSNTPSTSGEERKKRMMVIVTIVAILGRLSVPSEQSEREDWTDESRRSTVQMNANRK